MKNLIFLTCLYFQIFLVQCDIFVNNANGSDAKIKICIQKSINHLFSENETLSLILNNNNLCEDAIFEMNTMRQYIVLNMDVINGVNKLQYRGQFIICPKDLDSLNNAMFRALSIAQRNKRSMGNAKILVITNSTTYISTMFEIFWSYRMNNVIILLYEQETSKLLTCNRFAPENECGRSQKLMIHQDCEEQLSLSFTSVVRQMNKCPLIFGFFDDSMYVHEDYPLTRSLQYNIKELSHRLNATFQRAIIHNQREYEYLSIKKELIVILEGTNKGLGKHELTEPLIKIDAVWLVPKAGQVSNMDVCLKVFNYDVWIATSVIFISASLAWFLIISRNGGFTFDNLCISFLNVWSLTIFGNVARVPRSLALNILLFFYLIYAINMQFAFTSDMSTVLTTPHYGFQIRNLEELADSQLPIYIYYHMKEIYFKRNYTDRKLYTKLQNSLHLVTVQQYENHLLDLQLHGNYAIITCREEMRQIEIKSEKKIEGYKIMDSLITPNYDIRLRIPIDHYFTTTLNKFVNKMLETGIHEKHKNDLYREFDEEKVDASQDDLLTLKHLTFIFIFFGIGLCTACVVFCFELVLHKYL